MVEERAGLALYWLTSIGAALVFAVPGAALLAKIPHFEGEMALLGYPTYFLLPLGALKLAGAAMILLPGLRRLKEWAYAGMVFDTAFATYSRAAIESPLPQILLPLAIAGLVLASWALRPASRRL